MTSGDQTVHSADGTYRERVITHTSRRHIEVRESDCPDCGTTVSRLLDTRTFEWDTIPEKCWNCGAPAPWERDLDPVFQDQGMQEMSDDNEDNTRDEDLATTDGGRSIDTNTERGASP